MSRDRGRASGLRVTTPPFARSISFSLVSQRLHRIEAGGEVSGDERGERADQKRADANDPDILRHDLRGKFGELVDFAREDLDVQGRGQPTCEFVAVTDQRHAETKTGEGAEQSNHGPLAEKNPNDL